MRCFSIFCISLLVSTCALPVHSSDKHWFEIRSAHFRVVTDLNAKRGVEVARRCEQMRAAFALLMNRAKTHDPAPLLIFALDGQKEVDEFAGDTSRGKHAGLFLPGTDESFILIDASGDPWHAVYHEYAHELLNANTSTVVQTWFDEGFAEYFSTMDSNSHGTRLGMVPVAELQFLRQNGKLMRLSDMAAVRQGSPAYSQNGPAQAMFYAESWLLVHYLFDHQLVSRAELFFSLMANGKSLDEASELEFGMSPARLEADLLEYAKGERFRYFLLPATDVPADAAVSEMTETAARGLRADLRWHTKSQHSDDDSAAYAADIRALLQHEPDNPALLRQLGMALIQLEKKNEAVDLLTRAAKAEPAEVLNHYSLALALLSDVGKFSDLSSAGVLDRELAACVQLNPDFADVYRLQALSFSQRGLLQEAAAVMRKAFVLAPRSEIYELALADLEIKKHNWAPAVALLQELKSSHNPDVAKQAEYFLSQEVQQAAISKE
jgi:tetratricopeptide (TPR) repeat protein